MVDRYDDKDDDDSSQTFGDEMAVTSTPLERAMEDHSEGDLERSQLPAIEEYKSQVAASRARANQILARDSHSPRSIYTESKKKHKEYMIWGIVLSIVVIFSVSIGVSVGKKEAKQGSNVEDPFGGDFASVPPTGRPTHMFDTQTLEVVDFVTSMGWSDAEEARKQDSPQFRAANWVADNDPMNVDVGDTLEFRQRYALAVFYYTLEGERWFYESQLTWLSATSVCDWHAPFKTVDVGVWIQIGAKCHGGTEVKEIVLPNAGLRGQLPRELGILTGLEGLVLWENDLTGEFPQALQQLTYLQHIDFHNNFLQGMLPNWLGSLSQLTTLNLANTGVSGELPDLSSLADLATINIGYNDLRDNVGKLAPLRNVRNLIAANNSFFGKLDSDYLFGWPLLEIIDMSNNHLTGSLPGNLLSREHVEIIDLGGNMFGGTIPDSIPPDSKVALLALHNNQLHGDFDFILTHMTNLAHFDLSKNKFDGTLPTDWSSMVRLRYLFLAYNNFIAGSIPETLTKLSTIEDLSLQATKRQGSIPSGFGQVTSLKLLDFSYNSLTGGLPTDIGDATNLQFLFLNQNTMTGEVPGSLASLEQLRSLLLDHNEFSSMASQVCDHPYSQLDYFISDCSEISCPTPSCCTECCTDVISGGNETCNVEPWFEILDPISEYEYRRGVYEFHDNDIYFPNLDTTAPTAAPLVATPSPTEARFPTVTFRPTRV
ncbi:hypothetical protein MPSEU_000129600 [Mayamaea pseudoterrestris]|nr:hypothetical protein MPSEU_000129600 [Mayamaea pseudoterrestris]